MLQMQPSFDDTVIEYSRSSFMMQRCSQERISSIMPRPRNSLVDDLHYHRSSKRSSRIQSIHRKSNPMNMMLRKGSTQSISTRTKSKRSSRVHSFNGTVHQEVVTPITSDIDAPEDNISSTPDASQSGNNYISSPPSRRVTVTPRASINQSSRVSVLNNHVNAIKAVRMLLVNELYSCSKGDGLNGFIKLLGTWNPQNIEY